MSPIDVQTLVDRTLLKGVSVWKELDGVPGFEVNVAYVSKQQMIRIYETCTHRIYKKDAKEFVEELDREKVSKLWAEKVVIGWRGLTMEKFQRFFPAEVSDKEKNELVEPTLENRIALLWNSTEFENWCLAVATSPDYFLSHRAEKEKEVEQLGKS
jgi:hypothetical protein